MKDKNTLLYGVIIALIIPIIGYGFWSLVNIILDSANVTDKNGNIFQFSEKTVMLVSICLNLIPFNYSVKKRWDYAMRGCGLITFVLLMGWAFYFNLFEF